jgi:NAD(P)-dependent dehydrogenase (short-subunit alcohol dehydrogenase family)
MGMLDGRVAIITGGGRGIGRSIGRLIAEVGSNGPWSLDDLASKLVDTFKPVADGVPYSAFAAAQVASAG